MRQTYNFKVQWNCPTSFAFEDKINDIFAKLKATAAMGSLQQFSGLALLIWSTGGHFYWMEMTTKWNELWQKKDRQIAPPKSSCFWTLWLKIWTEKLSIWSNFAVKWYGESLILKTAKFSDKLSLHMKTTFSAKKWTCLWKPYVIFDS